MSLASGLRRVGIGTTGERGMCVGSVGSVASWLSEIKEVHSLIVLRLCFCSPRDHGSSYEPGQIYDSDRDSDRDRDRDRDWDRDRDRDRDWDRSRPPSPSSGIADRPSSPGRGTASGEPYRRPRSRTGRDGGRSDHPPTRSGSGSRRSSSQLPYDGKMTMAAPAAAVPSSDLPYVDALDLFIR